MKIQLVLSTILVASVAAALPNINSYDALVSSNKLGMYGGKSTTIQKHPYVASLFVFGGVYCAATIVSESWVVAPVACVNGLTPDQVLVVVGSNDGVQGKLHPAKSLVIHPQFSAETNWLDYHFACIEIHGKMNWSKKVKAAKLPSKRPAVNTVLQIAGYGLNSTKTGTFRLNDGVMKCQSTAVCNSTVAQLSVAFTDRMSCAWNKGKTTPCPGDAGDPLVKNGVYYGQVITALPTGFCSKDAQPAILADISSVASWIKNTTGAKFEHEY